MKFLSFVQQGVEKSNKSLAAIEEVDDAFRMVNADLKNYPGGELKLERTISTLAHIASITTEITGVELDHFKHDRLVLSLKADSGIYVEDVAGWRQRSTGYPCVLRFDGQELSCGNSAHLINGISELLASIGFGNAVNRLSKRALAEAKEKKSDGQVVTAKPAAKVTARPIKPARPAVKPVAARVPVAKAPPVKREPKKPGKKQDNLSDYSN